MRILFILVALLALGLGCVLLAAGPGVGLGLWDYQTAFKLFAMAAAPKEFAGGVALSPAFTAAGVSLLMGVSALLMRQPRVALFSLLSALVAGGGGYIPMKMRALAEANPFIHDITTDFENPPQIIEAANLDRKNPARYVGDDLVGDTGKTVAQSQMEAFPDLTPLFLKADMETSTKKARAAIEAMGMEIIAEGPADDETGGGWRIEAVETSRWFGFKDDFIVRLTAADNGETRIDVRSKSRVGGSDLGANAVRVRTFFEKVKAA
ncbi:MAG: DUF1499 domain-containing protein [Pseudomonadota bacterium]